MPDLDPDVELAYSEAMSNFNGANKRHQRISPIQYCIKPQEDTLTTHLVRYCHVVLATAALVCLPVLAAAPASKLEFSFDYEFARLVSMAIHNKNFDEKTLAAIRAAPASQAMVKKMGFKDSDALIDHLRAVPEPAKAANAAEAAAIVSAALAQPGGGKYAAVAKEVTRLLQQYVPAQFAARYRVQFIYGSGSLGFALTDDPDNVYVDLSKMSTATNQELAETVAHELFHAVQASVMPPPPSAAAVSAGAAGATGPAPARGVTWTNRLLYDLLQEGTAELFTHPIGYRPATAFSQRVRDRIERNERRMRGIVRLVETVGQRLHFAPPRDEADYEGIYGLLFYMSFDETAYDLGWVMANAIEQKEGKAAIMGLLKQAPKHFVLRYQAIAETDAKLPQFSAEFLRLVQTLPEN